MRRTSIKLVLPIAVLLASGCAAATSNGDGAISSTFRRTLARATPFDVSKYSRQILERYLYQLERSEETEFYVMFETRWKGRYPFEDEIAAGIQEARSRVTIRARATRGAGDGTGPVEFVAENLVLLEDGGGWVPRVSPMVEDHFKEVADALRSELQTRIRVRG